MIYASNLPGSTMILDTPEERMCDDEADAAVVSDKTTTVNDNHMCFAEYKADIYTYMKEKEVMFEKN